MIYFPRPEHAIIKYGEQEIHYAVAIPAGEGRYVLNRLTGKIDLKIGPAMFLADPRHEVIVRRVLDPRQVELWFPGNQEALEYNRRLRELNKGDESSNVLTDQALREQIKGKRQIHVQAGFKTEEPTGLVGDDFTRHQSFTPPRTITLDTKYEGAVTIDVWTGYAVQIVTRTGERKVLVGPATHHLEYDAILEAMELSTGTPKSDEKTIKTAYLRVLHNKVSDFVTAETKDLVDVQIKLSLRMNFTGEPSRWFNVENYVKFLTDHTRSLLRYAIKHLTVETFYADAAGIIRDTILGKATDVGKRPGRLFPENGMQVYDLEVLDVKIGDKVIEGLMVGAQHSVVKQNLELASERRNLEFVQQTETIKQRIAEAQARTTQLEFELQTQQAKSEADLQLSKLESAIENRQRDLAAKAEDQDVLSKLDEAERDRRRQALALDLDTAQKKLALQLEDRRSDVEAVVNKATAISPELIAALQAFGDKALAERMAQSMAPLAILGGTSVAEVFSQLIKGTPLEQVLAKKPSQPPARTS
jgi:major vault protein